MICAAPPRPNSTSPACRNGSLPKFSAGRKRTLARSSVAMSIVPQRRGRSSPSSISARNSSKGEQSLENSLENRHGEQSLTHSGKMVFAQVGNQRDEQHFGGRKQRRKSQSFTARPAAARRQFDRGNVDEL